MSALRVLVDARVRPGEQGGVQQAIMGLAAGLSTLQPDGFEIGFLVQGDDAWLRPYVSGTCRIVPTTSPTPLQLRGIAAAARVHPTLGVGLRLLLEARPGPLPRPDPAVADFRPAVIHFMKHRGWRTEHPNVYVPHDLQHVAMPEHFDGLTRLYRRVVYGAMARQADAVVALTSDQAPLIARHHQLPADRVSTIGWASTLAIYDLEPVRVADLPDRFALFPATTWPHKRHDLLVAALTRLRARGLDIPVVLTGGRTPAWQGVLDSARDGGVDDLLVDLGYVSEGEVLDLYRRASMLVFPSHHEGFGMPVVEALDAGVPVVCADIGVMRAIAGDAAARFAVDDASDLARAMEEVWTDPAAAAAMVDAGHERAAAFTWTATASAYLDLYARVAGQRGADVGHR